MKVDGKLATWSTAGVVEAARRHEAAGYDGLWASESAHDPFLPLVLAALSVAGVFAGMIFRVRAFLLLGSTFLLLAIATMIKYASVNFGWTWLWYVAGIVTGALIIATFAVFEKKRAEVLRVVDGLKDWQR